MEIVKHNQLPMSEIATISEAFAKSGLFADAKDASQALVKIYAGQEIGLPPFAAMSGIHVIQGKPVMGAGLIASRVKGSGKYDYKVKEHTEKICSIDFFQMEMRPGGLHPVDIGNSTFTIEDAKKAGTKNLDKFPKNMLFARAISNGVKWYCPDVFAGPIYVPEEMAQVTEDAPATITTWSPSAQDMELANELIKSSTLDDNKKAIAANGISNAKNQKEVDKLINRLREVQTS